MTNGSWCWARPGSDVRDRRCQVGRYRQRRPGTETGNVAEPWAVSHRRIAGRFKENETGRGRERLTMPAPCASIDCWENWCAMVSRSRAISIGYLKVSGLSLVTLLTNPCVTHSCHACARSQCWVTRISTAWASVQSRYAGTASASWVCSCAIHAGFACVCTRFQRLTNVSSMILYMLTMSSNPAAMGRSEGTSSSAGG